MVKVLGYELSDYDVAEYEKAPKLVVKKWSGGEYYTLSPEYDKNQMFYNSLVRSDERPYYDKNDLQEMADEFNNDENLDEDYRQSRMIAVNNLIDYYTKSIKEKQNELDKFKKLKAKLDLEADK
jgi:hypothetical protein